MIRMTLWTYTNLTDVALSDAKVRAIDLLVAGVQPGIVAKRLDVSRQTLWRWGQELGFREHLQHLRLELHDSRIDRAWALVDRSFDVIQEHLDEGNLQAASIVLRAARLNATDPVPSSGRAGASSRALDP